MQTLLNITVLGDPVAKARPRTTKTGHTYTPKKTADAEHLIRVAALEAYPYEEPYAAPVGIKVTFYCATKRRTDGDNLQKLVMDSLNQIVFVDDFLVEEWSGRLFRRADGEEPRTEILVYSLDPDAEIDMREVIALEEA